MTGEMQEEVSRGRQDEGLVGVHRVATPMEHLGDVQQIATHVSGK